MLGIINSGIYMKCGELITCDASKFINIFSGRRGSENVNYLSFQQNKCNFFYHDQST